MRKHLSLTFLSRFHLQIISHGARNKKCEHSENRLSQSHFWVTCHHVYINYVHWALLTKQRSGPIGMPSKCYVRICIYKCILPLYSLHKTICRQWNALVEESFNSMKTLTQSQRTLLSIILASLVLSV